jgi:hypothetical protein
MFKHDSKSREVKIGFKYDHFAYAAVELIKTGKFRKPVEASSIKISSPF